MTASIMNTHVRDNLNALKAPPTSIYNVNTTPDYTTTSTSFTNIDGTNLSLSITTTGGDLLVVFFAMYTFSAAGPVHFNITLDGTAQAADDGFVGMRPGGTLVGMGFICMPVLLQSVSAATHTVAVQWKVGTAGTATLYNGAGTATADIHPQFWVREF